MQEKNKEIIVQGNNYEIYKVDETYVAHLYGGSYVKTETLEEALEWTKDFN